ncbi:CMGC family protein kinase [Tritrichomonas foetus]|uniref:CMGC family protein kinase n=1 Tax=Tritrichomonas foetus TaxID=1144522 RepID=A0A1J4J3C3_9EUKA|nr:CMGC family protein kinase [Tritrichomonas foetus]|eukprot:OHS93952.1 CMGC family protein kinase [Tritrichomonas foetus]
MHRIKPTNKSIIVKAPNKVGLSHRPRYPNVSIGTASHAHSPLLSARYYDKSRQAHPQATFTSVDFEGPVKPAYIFLNYPGLLTKDEEKEIMKFREIYYIRKSKPSQKFNQQSGEFYHYVKDDHIAYRYQQEHVIGKGSFGSVLQCFDHKDRKRVAIKLLNYKPKLHSQIIFELDLLKSLQAGNNESENNIIKFIDSFEFRNFFCIVMELASFDLYTVLKRQHFRGLSGKKLQLVARDTAVALKYMHNKGIIHCDIKPENILFSSIVMDKAKVIDFGCSCYVGKLMFSYIQSRYYRAPEVVFGFEYGTEIDIWSLGCVLCELVTGQPIFPAEDEYELMQMLVAVLGMPPKRMIEKAPRSHHYFDKTTFQPKPHKNSRGKVHEPCSSSITKETRIVDRELVDLVEKCLRWEPKDRLNAEQFLNHPWIKKQFNDDMSIPMSAR